MPPLDDIRNDSPSANDGEPTLPAEKPMPPRREIGPESEVRGGPEASDDDDIVKP